MTGLRFPKPAPRLLAKRQRAADKGRHWRLMQAYIRARYHGLCVVCGADLKEREGRRKL